MPVNRRKFLKQAAGVPLAAQLMPAAPPPAPFRSYAEEMPDMLLQHLANKTNTLAAGCDLALHCSGVLSEMEEVAEASSSLSPQAQTRIARGETLRLVSRQEFDRRTAEARFAELLAQTATVATSR